jgi:hypothetical protein
VSAVLLSLALHLVRLSQAPPVAGSATTVEDAPAANPAPSRKPADKLWAFEIGLAAITDDVPADLLSLKYQKLAGPGAGYTYNFTITRELKRFDWKWKGMTLFPRIEVPFRFTLVNENSEGLIPDVNGGVAGRWTEFPWNEYVSTSISVGFGLSYSHPVWTADIERHRGQPRSPTKFWMPAEFTLALPKYPNYQAVAFTDHQSGGKMFDAGGVDAWGFGIRVKF